ncbi:hypothetical protein CDFC105_32398 [Clostridioides difficile]|nr:hypothetical protein CDFC105_21266 [Clostridioides difficile]CZR92381.1 hypothetical protein CDFC105_32398 [Clostridioides difficile]
MGEPRIINEKCPVINEFISLYCEYSTSPNASGTKLISAECNRGYICDSSSDEECPILKKLIR